MLCWFRDMKVSDYIYLKFKSTLNLMKCFKNPNLQIVFLGRPKQSYLYSCLKLGKSLTVDILCKPNYLEFRRRKSNLQTCWSGSCAPAQRLLIKWQFPFCLAIVCAYSPLGQDPRQRWGLWQNLSTKPHCELSKYVCECNCELQSTLQAVMSQMFQTQYKCTKNGQSVLTLLLRKILAMLPNSVFGPEIITF